MLPLNRILKNIPVIARQGSDALSIQNIHFDSRRIEEGDLFFALKGTRVDGRGFIAQAVRNGARAVVCEHPPPPDLPRELAIITVGDPNAALGIAASDFYGAPSRSLALVGVTGTNGKTTIATSLFRLFRKRGYKVGLLSTIQNRIHDEKITTTHTTPDALRINRLIRKMVDAGCQYCFMEVSSHALAQQRVSGLRFAGGIFSNLTQDHLDYHETFEQYRDAKKSFFDRLPPDAFALANADDPNANLMLRDCHSRKFHYATRTSADFNCRILEKGFDGMTLDLSGIRVRARLTGAFNASNLLAVHGAAMLLGQPREAVLAAISSLGNVAGRFESMRASRGVTAIIDYAHTPDALENVLETIRGIRNGNQRIITVVGAGGDRDRTKRPLMGRIVARSSDRVILTTDNPRSEDPARIIDDMRQGIRDPDQQKVARILDRRQAIETALSQAAPGDIVLVAGKGHETYQEIRGVRNHFDDKEVVLAFDSVHDLPSHGNPRE
uniref:UDP-N-acetylmuramoyl-L-alanyl-D-glutamate--2,6-diaminopimelate ligase n=1 Tax=Candidatus Kentrum sp. SD TaxID=2126332 RepID=A0A451BJS0_9GAMM|nr:MAG: UDP-N-acetylmuramoylalanyl-D-glutamate--2,6-diaminopimelate ligase [Candidatus Kentron sp. SD]VFK43824.1 MAG: UDP-N-acetylmuramoylalanyl-D-glutamate--2,6-diaminopimelate ligase [Candidatus Kentron sp. SD]VFK78544.1 MAG: UDP-N-acetylmuramoylalanyl-D-glutamate--2,6-diaminopimelate ligase [Candidatus Kentron sp. SD]